MPSATAVAHPNIALAKYWGKREGAERMPAVPSLSVTLEGMTTTTTVTFDESLEADLLVLGGVVLAGRPAARASAMLDRVRARAGIALRARIESASDFPTAAGLASSASGFAALALAASRAAGLTPSPEELSDLARQSSVSAARSIFGGYVELPVPPEGAVALSAALVADGSRLPLTVLVAVTREGEKSVSSSAGMALTERTSPYYPAWVADAPRLFSRIRGAILEGDFTAVGAAAEVSAIRMHAAALASEPPILYWTGATVAVLEAVHALRSEGLEAYATIDAGPHVKVLTRPADAAAVRREISRVPGVRGTIETRPGQGARLIPTEGHR